MFKYCGFSFCCKPNTEISIHIELFSHEDLNLFNGALPSPSHSYFPQRYRTFGLTNDQPKLDLTGLYFYIFLDIPYGDILNNQDFLYLADPNEKLSGYIDGLNAEYIIALALNRFSSNTAFCNFHLSGLTPFKEYQIVYYRKAPNTGKLISLQKTKKFKIIPKRTLKAEASFEFVIIYEDNLHFGNENLAREFLNHFEPKSVSYHKKHAKSLAEPGTFSTKAAKSLNDSKANDPRSNQYSFFNSTLPNSEANIYSNYHTNKNSLYDNPFLPDNGTSKRGSISDTRKSINTLNRIAFASGRDQFEAINANISKDESLINVNETFIVNENPDNDDYVHKICNILDENLTLNPAFSTEQPLVKSSKPKNRHQQSLQPIDLNNSKIFQFVKLQEQRRNANNNLKSKESEKPITHEDSPSLFTSGKKTKSVFSVMNSTELDKENINPNIPSGLPRAKLQQNANKSRREPLSEKNLEMSFKKSKDRSYFDSESRNPLLSPTEGTRRSNFGPKSYKKNEFMQFSKKESHQEKKVIIDCIDEIVDVEEDVINSDLAHHNTPRASLKIKTAMSDRKNTANMDSETAHLLKKSGCEHSRDSSNVTPRMGNVDLKTLPPRICCERLYTVEEVCSPSKEGSTRGDPYFKSLHSRSDNTMKVTNSTIIRMRTSDFFAVSEQSEVDDVVIGISPRHCLNTIGANEKIFSSEFNMIVAKFEALGLTVECEPATCAFHIKQRDNDKFHLVYHWDEQTREQDLSSFFEDIYLSLKTKLFLNTQNDEYVML